ncbi:hypothetical protein Hanom_Chr07g00614081 [Helianthus anomalus]
MSTNCTDEESVSEDTSNFPTLVEFFSQENRDELRRKVAEFLQDKSIEGTIKDPQREERKKWFRKDTKRKFKRPLKFYKRDRDVSLGDIISWGYLPQVSAYAIRREYGVQYFSFLYDIMSLPWWDVEELSKVRTLDYPIRKLDGFKHRKPHNPKKVKRVDPVTGVEETILHEKKPRVMKNIPVPKMEQEFYNVFMEWVYSCMTAEAVITYRAQNEVREIFIYDPLWVRGINADNKWSSKWWKIEEEEKLKREKERKAREDKDNMLRHTVNQRMATEEKKRVDENEKLRKLLVKKPK